ncbi:hypothetical protein [Rhizobium laguerreae]|uniref:hypothetical protein n=1 Tax=Rhizobium laguerreae TaxID=1076926 RepID=UPI001C8FCE52|nr:hypothetical protein [Rhizobium laguerreae]MBY3477233.1 hypothetical protein [Rhizobium laguerreae]
MLTAPVSMMVDKTGTTGFRAGRHFVGKSGYLRDRSASIPLQSEQSVEMKRKRRFDPTFRISV